MGGLFGGSTPKPLPTPARPVTAVSKSPELELDDTDVKTNAGNKEKTGKKALKVNLKQTTGQTPKASAGLQIPKGT